MLFDWPLKRARVSRVGRPAWPSKSVLRSAHVWIQNIVSIFFFMCSSKMQYVPWNRALMGKVRGGGGVEVKSTHQWPQVCQSNEYFLAPCQGIHIHDSLGFWIPRVDSGFFVTGTWIPDHCYKQNFQNPDSGFLYMAWTFTSFPFPFPLADKCKRNARKSKSAVY